MIDISSCRRSFQNAHLLTFAFSNKMSAATGDYEVNNAIQFLDVLDKAYKQELIVMSPDR